MPQRGGYLDQPARWRRMIHLFNRRFHLAYEDVKAEHPHGRSGAEDEEVDIGDLIGQGGGYGWDNLPRG